MNKLKMAIANLGLSIAIQSDPFTRPITDGFSQGYSYPVPTNRITGHAKINRAAKKRRARK